jgi:hypothetical protein
MASEVTLSPQLSFTSLHSFLLDALRTLIETSPRLTRFELCWRYGVSCPFFAEALISVQDHQNSFLRTLVGRLNLSDPPNIVVRNDFGPSPEAIVSNNSTIECLDIGLVGARPRDATHAFQSLRLNQRLRTLDIPECNANESDQS